MKIAITQIKDYFIAIGYDNSDLAIVISFPFKTDTEALNSIYEVIPELKTADVIHDDNVALAYATYKAFIGDKINNAQYISQLALYGSEKERCVLRECAKIPHGETISYGELAARANVKSSRFVGTVMRKNRFPLIIPCHRVIRADGNLGFYGGSGHGTSVKRELIRREKMAKFG